MLFLVYLFFSQSSNFLHYWSKVYYYTMYECADIASNIPLIIEYKSRFCGNWAPHDCRYGSKTFQEETTRTFCANDQKIPGFDSIIDDYSLHFFTAKQNEQWEMRTRLCQKCKSSHSSNYGGELKLLPLNLSKNTWSDGEERRFIRVWQMWDE